MTQTEQFIKATEKLKTEHKIIRLALIILNTLRTQIESEKKVDTENLEKLLEFFSIFADKCHHGKEENFLFPELEKAGIPKESGPIGVMLYEHQSGRHYLRTINESIKNYKSNQDISTLTEIAEAINEYTALLENHIYKENNILFAMADMHLPDEIQQKLSKEFDDFEIDEIGPQKHDEFHHMLHKMKDDLLGKSKVLDVRDIAPAQRHTLIFEEFNKLKPSESFILVNDHDPKPLYYQFQAEKEGEFDWEYICEGPVIWGVKITKKS